MVDWAVFLGAGAAILSTVSFAPQAWRIIRSGDTGAISPPTYAFTVGAFALWLSYGAVRAEWPLIVPNALCLALSGFILVMVLLPGRRRRAIAAALDPTETRDAKPRPPGDG